MLEHFELLLVMRGDRLSAAITPLDDLTCYLE